MASILEAPRQSVRWESVSTVLASDFSADFFFQERNSLSSIYKDALVIICVVRSQSFNCECFFLGDRRE